MTHNTLWEADPNAEQIADGFYGSSSVFLAIHERGRFIVNVEWRPFNDPKGRFLIRLLYAPFARTERGRRTETRVEFRGSQVVREIEATSRASLVGELEALLAYGAETQQEAN